VHWKADVHPAYLSHGTKIRKKINKRTNNKTELLRRYDPGNSPRRQSRGGKRVNGKRDLWNRCVLSQGWRELWMTRVVNQQRKTMRQGHEEVSQKQRDRDEVDEDIGSWFHRQIEAYSKERSVIHRHRMILMIMNS